MQVKHIGDTPGLDTPPDGLVSLLVGASAVANAASLVYVADGYDGYPDGHAARCRVEAVACVLIHTGHDADGAVAGLGADAAADGLVPRRDPGLAARRPACATAAAVARRWTGQLVLRREPLVRRVPAGLDPAPLAALAFVVPLDLYVELLDGY